MDVLSHIFRVRLDSCAESVSIALEIENKHEKRWMETHLLREVRRNNCSNGDKGAHLETIFPQSYSWCCAWLCVISNCMKNEAGKPERFEACLLFSPPHS